MGQISIQGTQAFPITSPTGALITGQNIGVGNLYLGKTVNTNPNSYDQLLDPGGRFSWPGDQNLYVATDTDNVGTLSYTNNGATVIPGSAFAKASNAPVLLDTRTITVTDAAAVATIQSTIISTGYASILYVLTNNTATPIPTANSFVTLTASQHGIVNVGNTVVNQAQYLWAGSSVVYNDSCTLQVPVRDAIVTATLQVNKIAGTNTAGTITLQVFGTNETINSAKYLHSAASLFGQIAVNGAFTVNNIGVSDTVALISSINGPAKLSYTNNSASGTGFAQAGYYDTGGTGRALGIASINTGGATVTAYADFLLPMRPIYVRTYAGVASTSMLTALTQ